MKSFRLLGIIFLAVGLIGTTSCATKKKEAVTTEVQPSVEEITTHEAENRGRMEKEKLETIKEEEVKAVPQEEEVRDMEFDRNQALEIIYFDFDKYNLTFGARQLLEKNADWMNAFPDAIIQIAGNCDERGTEEYNMALGDRRAGAVKDYLVSLGVDASRLHTISYGEERPVDPGHNEEAWARNRRVEFQVTFR